MMKRTYFLLAVFFVACAISTHAQQAPAEKELIDLLNRFLEGASINDADTHERFWAEDLIYTSSSGERFGKKQIMDGLPGSSEQESESTTTYTAEDIRIQQYGDMAVVAFRLVGKTMTEDGDGVETANYLNSGTFLKRNGQWKVVNWQATKVPNE